MFPEMNRDVLALVEETFEDEVFQWYELCYYDGKKWVFVNDDSRYYDFSRVLILKWRYCEECFE